MTTTSANAVRNDPAEPFVHPALFYSGPEEYLAGTLPFVTDGLKAGDPVAVAVPGPNLSLLREALGADAASVLMLDMNVVGRNPGRIIPGVLRAFSDGHPRADRVWIVGEPIWAERTSLEYPACAQHEALINLAFTGRNVSILCPYDTSRLDAAVVADARVTHPVIWHNGRVEASTHYAPDKIINGYNQPFPAPRPDTTLLLLDYDYDNLAQLRHVTAEHAARHGLTPERTGDIEVVVHELASNSVVHADGKGVFRAWAQDGLFICEISDAGHIADPLAGRHPVGLSASGGRGLLLAQHLSDLVRVHTTPGGTTIRAHFALPAPLTQ